MSGLKFSYMADFERLERAIHSIKDGFEHACMECMESNRYLIADLVREQLYSGLDGNTDSLRPTYYDDIFFEQTKGRWRNDPDGYIDWKQDITPPVKSPRLNLPPQPSHVPNLYITGTFHESIKASVKGDALMVETVGFSDGQNIVRKYGDNILGLGIDAREYIVIELLEPYLYDFYKKYWK